MKSWVLDVVAITVGVVLAELVIRCVVARYVPQA